LRGWGGRRGVGGFGCETASDFERGLVRLAGVIRDEILARNPCCALGLDYRQVGVEHVLVGGFAALRAKAQRAIDARCGLRVPVDPLAGISMWEARG